MRSERTSVPRNRDLDGPRGSTLRAGLDLEGGLDVAGEAQVGFLVVAFLGAAFFVVAFLAGAFLAARLRGVVGPLARRSANSSAARSMVTSSTESPRRSDALVSPSVTYGPNRPSLITMGLSVAGSLPSSRSGAAADARRPRDLGCANRASASSRVTVKSCSSFSRERE